MKKCFACKCYADGKKVATFLQTVIPSTVHQQLDNSITVDSAIYSKAIIEGKNFVTQEGINCNWVDSTGNEVPMDLVPFAIVALTSRNDNIIQPYSLSKEALIYITNFADLCENVTGNKVFVQPRPNGTIAFLFKMTWNDFSKHSEQVEKIMHKSKEIITSEFASIIFTDIFGKII